MFNEYSEGGLRVWVYRVVTVMSCYGLRMRTPVWTGRVGGWHSPWMMVGASLKLRDRELPLARKLSLS